MRRVRLMLGLACLLCCPISGLAQIPAFPGAEGFGAYATGGRGGDVYYVTTLNTSGAGSFADAIATVPSSGRTIVFGVSGYIHVNKTSLSKSKVTIAGQTAPGDGIGFKDGSFIINGSDVVIRHARFRYGDQIAGGDCINLDEGITNVILDHVSMAFSTDENISSFEQSPRPDLMTFQWSLNAWGLVSHSCGGLWDLQRITTHHTLWAHNQTRNPKARPYGLLDWINNVTFDWGIGFIMGDSETPAPWKANVQGNYFVCPPGNLRSVALEKANIDRNGGYNFTLHVGANLFDKNGNTILDGSDYGYGIASGSYQVSNAPIVVAGSQVPVTQDPPLTAYKKVVSRAGPLRLDALSGIPLRDEVDTILINNLVALKQNQVSHENQTGASNNGMGYLNSATAPVDTDLDGMPDHWETTLGWSPGVQDHNTPLPSSGGYISGITFFPTATPAGYTRLEEYLHFLTIPHASIRPNVATNASSLSVDLRRYTSGFKKAPVTFTFSSVYNGTVALQPDGFTAVFTPTLNFSGRARYDFTVTDGDGSTWRQTMGIMVSAVSLPRPSASLNWRGTINSSWDLSTSNWLNGSASDRFYNLDTVSFDSAGLVAPTVNLSGSLSPASITVNSTGNYTFQGTGAISGSGSLTKSGPGVFSINTTNSGFSGDIVLTGGTLTLGAGANVGSGNMTLRGGSIWNFPPSSPAYFFSGSIIVPSSNSATIYSPGLGNGISGNLISGSSGSFLNISSGVSFGGLTSSQFDSFVGTIRILPGGTLRFSPNSSGNTYGSLSPTFIIDGALRPRNAGNTVRIGAFSGTGSLEGPQTAAGAGNTTYLLGAHNQDVTFDGVISSNSALAGSTVIMRKTGTGKLVLSGASNYTGGTTVEGGALIVNNGTGSGTGTGSLLVKAGATLGGSGRIGSPTTLENTAVLSPGNSPGTLTFDGSLVLGSGSVLQFELGSASDQVIANGPLTLDGTLNISAAPGFGPRTYVLVRYNPAASFFYGGLVIGSAPAGGSYNVDVSVPGEVRLLVSPLKPPFIGGVVMQPGLEVSLTGSDGIGGSQYVVVSSTNLLAPPGSWVPLATNSFDNAGGFSWTNLQPAVFGKEFYMLRY